MKPAGGGVYTVAVRQLAVREVPGSARPAVPGLSDGVIPRLRSGRQRDRPRLRVHARQRRAHLRHGLGERARGPEGRLLLAGVRSAVPQHELVGDMPNDGAVVPQVFDLRARIEDDGNSGPTGLKGLRVAGIDPDATAVYILDDVRSGADRRHRRRRGLRPINPHLVPTTRPPTQNNQVLKVRLAGVPGQGDADLPRRRQGPRQLPLSARRPCRPKPSASATSPSIDHLGLRQDLPVIWSIEPIDEGLVHGLAVRHPGQQHRRRAGRASPCSPRTGAATPASRPRCASTSIERTAGQCGRTPAQPDLRPGRRHPRAPEARRQELGRRSRPEPASRAGSTSSSTSRKHVSTRPGALSCARE